MRRRIIWGAMAGLALLGAAACSNEKKPPATPTGLAAAPGATATASVTTCPVDAPICQFAVDGEKLLRDKDTTALVANGHALASTAESMLNMLYAVGGVPRLVTIGCPLTDGVASCRELFAVAYSALPPGLQERDGRGIDVAVYRRTSSRPVPVALTFPEGGDRAVVVKGGETSSCTLAGEAAAPGACTKFRFYVHAGNPPPGPIVGKLPPLRTLPGARVMEMTLGDPYAIKPGEAWYYTYLCDACGPPPIPSLWRAYRAADGQLVFDDLRERLRPLGTVVSFVANWEQGLAYVATCQGVCGPTMEGGSHFGFGETVYKSEDGGISWREHGRLPDGTRLLGLVGGEVLTGRYAGREEQPSYSYYPSGRTLERSPRIPADAYPVIPPGLAVVWGTRRGEYFDESGRQLFGPLFAEQYPSQIVVADHQYQHTYLHWSERAVQKSWKEAPAYEYVAHIDRDGQMREAYGLPGDTLWIEGEFRRAGDAPAALYGRFRFGGEGGATPNTSFGAVLDLATAKVHPLSELTAGAGLSQFVHVRGLVQLRPPERSPQAGFLRVTGTGECLNIREKPTLDALAIACYADGVLLAQADEQQNFAGSNGITWSLVGTPDGRFGYASAEFLK